VSVEVSSDRARIEVHVVHRYLAEESYWAQGITRDKVERSIAHSLPFGAYENGAQIAFARVITDFVTFAYIADVFVLPAHRGRGVSKQLMQAIVSDPRLQELRRWHLVTRDAQGLYAQFGFTPLDAPERHMMRRRS
jgi:N-acetylglutamate synthase-like GNAT family acetyltransferase